MESRLSYNCVDRATVFDPVYLLLLMTLPNHHPTLLAQLLLPCPHASCVPGGAERLDADDDVAVWCGEWSVRKWFCGRCMRVRAGVLTVFDLQ